MIYLKLQLRCEVNVRMEVYFTDVELLPDVEPCDSLRPRSRFCA